ncbi:MAG: hypothetical protein C4K60_05210 [Ideonella sp. MAG2]|nr:MAG: hypothetical protein C4K60_05210 [Ideonella sp. MAG2]
MCNVASRCRANRSPALQGYHSGLFDKSLQTFARMSTNPSIHPKNVSPLPVRSGVGFAWQALWTTRRKGTRALQPVLKRFAVPSLDDAHVQRYRQALGFAQPGLPLTYLYLLAQRAHLAVMLSPNFPYALPGTVHVANDLHWVGSAAQDFEPSRASTLELRIDPELPSASGAHFLTLHASFCQHGPPLAVCSSRYLVKRGARTGARRPRDELPPRPLSAEWARYRLPKDAGRTYAKLSGDANPIHLWPWSARLLGFPQPIIHGMHTLGHVAADMERVYGRRLQRLQARFLRPIPMPGVVVVLGQGHQAQAWSGGVLALAAEGAFMCTPQDQPVSLPR